MKRDKCAVALQVYPSFKVELPKENKLAIGLPSAPRELDLVAHKGASNEVLVVQCKLVDSIIDTRRFII